MAHWHDVAVTSEGVAMLNEMMAGHPLQLTSAYGGTGVVDAAALGEQTAMVDQKQKLALIDEQDGPDGKTVTVQISSAGNDAEYLLRQIGVYAKLSKDGAEEKLLFLMQDEGVVIPDETEENFLLEIYCTLHIGKNAKLTVTIDPTGIVTLQRMKDALDKYRTLWEDSDPTAATVGTVGQHYLNIVTKKEFVCVAASEEGYIWQASGANTADDITVGGKPLTEVLGTVEPEEGTSAPTEQTAGVVGQKYTDTSTGKVYTCIAVSLGEDGGTRYTWVEGSLGTLADIRTALLDVSTTLEHKAPAGLVASVIRCFTNDDIEAAINTCYSTMADNTIRNIILTISVGGLDLPGGNNFLTVCRRNVNFGMILSYTYSKHFIASRAYLDATWQEWRYVMFTDERYGLGDVIGPSCSDFHTLKYNGWYYINNADNSPVFGGVEYRWGVALVIAARTHIQIEYWAQQAAAPCNQHFRRLWNAEKGWLPWEVINPNMDVGSEYRTVERYDRKPTVCMMRDIRNRQ